MATELKITALPDFSFALLVKQRAHPTSSDEDDRELLSCEVKLACGTFRGAAAGFIRIRELRELNEAIPRGLAGAEEFCFKPIDGLFELELLTRSTGTVAGFVTVIREFPRCLLKCHFEGADRNALEASGAALRDLLDAFSGDAQREL